MTVDGQPSLPPSFFVGDCEVNFELASCNLCGSSSEEEVFRARDRLGLPGLFRVARCRGCGLLRQNPRPTAETIGAYYPAGYEPYSRSLRDERNPVRRLDRWYGIFKRRRFVERFHRSGALLDVGCATGNFLAEMQRTGHWRVMGIEPDEAAGTEARRQHQLDVQIARLDQTALTPGQFDVVTLWNVVEHLHEPIDDLRRVRGWLRSGGWLVLSLPNLGSLEARLFAHGWAEWELPRHLYFFSQSTLATAFGAIGLRLVARTCLSGSQLSFAHSLVTMFPSRATAPLWNRLAVRALPTLPARLALLPTFHAISRAGLASTITVVAQKVDG